MKKYMHDFMVIRNKRISNNYFVLDLECPEKLPEIKPGQFVQVLVENSPNTYLRRPFSIYHIDNKINSLSLLIKIIGAGTMKLSRLEEGQKLNLIYPLGNSFSISKGTRVLIIGGGVGIAPMLLLTMLLKNENNHIDVLIGGRTSGDIIEPERYKPYARVHITTEDGSLGEKGMITQHSIFDSGLQGYSKIYTCGPDPMMKAVATIAFSMGIPCEVSLENLMACGIGACLCCIVETVEGNKTSCLEGPVFDTRKLSGWNS
jgi:dihydroorotate dehydrogenase electron transfer subunit